jgi:hypothetical protein
MPTASKTLATKDEKAQVSKDEPAILDRLSMLSTEDLRHRLSETLNRTVDDLREAAACVRLLEERGEDMSELRGSLFNYLRLIAYGQLEAEVLVRFAGSPSMMRTVASLPLPDQKRLAEGQKVEVAVRRGNVFDTRLIAPLNMRSEQFRQVFAGGRIRSIPEQIAQLEASPVPIPGESPESSRRRPTRIEADAKTATLRIGRATAPVKDVLGALSDIAPIDDNAEGPGGTVTVDADLYEPLRRIASAGKTTVRSLVRRAIMQTFFPGDDKTD